MKKNLLCGAALVGALVFAGIAVAQRPMANIDARRHPHLAEAQQHLIKAYQEAEEARAAHKDELGGHAEKAIELMSQADHELKEAAEYSNHRK